MIDVQQTPVRDGSARGHKRSGKKATENLEGMESILKRIKQVILMVKYMDNSKVNGIYK